MLKTFVTVAALLSSTALASTTCPSWFEDLGTSWLAKAPDSPGLQMTIWSPRCNLHCNGAWANNFDNYTAHPPVEANTPSRLGSVTKPFTAVTVLKLVEAGVVDVNAPIGEYLPDWAVNTLNDQQGSEWAGKITPWMLMHHISGLPNHVEDPKFMEFLLSNPGLEMTHREVLEWVAREIPAGGAPGEIYRYSDLGYTYLGAAIEHLTNGTLGAAAREAGGWNKLCMKSTFWEVYEEKPPGIPEIARQFLGDVDTSDLPATPYGGSGVVSNSEDLARFARGFHTGLLLGEEGMNLTYTTVPTNEGIQEYGCGWTWNVAAGREVWFHRGAWAAWMYYIPSLDLALGGALNQVAHRPTVPLLVEDIIQRVIDTGCE